MLTYESNLRHLGRKPSIIFIGFWEEKCESGYDICVIKSGVQHRRKLAQNIYRMLYGVGIPVDVIVETPERFDELKDNPLQYGWMR